MALQNKESIAMAIIALLGHGSYREKASLLVMKGEKAIQPLLDYLEKYPLKYQSETYNWYKECFNLRKYVKKNRSDATAKQQRYLNDDPKCGFSPVYGQTRNPFSIQFYLVGILFLVFDLEILLVYPSAL